jgi:ABC-type spermidine/putrescine transport systems, ATPase components
MTVEANVAFGLKQEGVPKAELKDRVQTALDLVQMGRFAKRKPHQLSGGQQQRVALARSLVKRPKLLCSTSRCPRSTNRSVSARRSNWSTFSTRSA